MMQIGQYYCKEILTKEIAKVSQLLKNKLRSLKAKTFEVEVNNKLNTITEKKIINFI